MPDFFPLRPPDEIRRRAIPELHWLLGLDTFVADVSYDEIIDQASSIARRIERAKIQKQAESENLESLRRHMSKIIALLDNPPPLATPRRARRRSEVEQAGFIQAAADYFHSTREFDDETLARIDASCNQLNSSINALHFVLETSQFVSKPDKRRSGRPQQFAKPFFVIRLCEIYAFHTGAKPPYRVPPEVSPRSRHAGFLSFLEYALARSGFGRDGLDDILKNVRDGLPRIGEDDPGYAVGIARIAENSSSDGGHLLDLDDLRSTLIASRFGILEWF